MVPEQQFNADPRSSRGDKYLFALLFAVGAVLIVGAKLLKLPTWVPVAIAVADLFCYSVAASRIDRFKLREDRVGDNAYYLGFLFTLTSLAFALWAFQTEGDVPSVIGNFALALVSTILGLAIRVWFQQLREDPVEFEHEARLALVNAVSELRTQLVLAVEDISTIRTRLANEVQQDFIAQAKQLSGNAVAEIRKVADNHSAWLATTATQLKDDRTQVIAQSSELKGTVTRLSKALQALSLKIEQDESPTTAFKQRFSDLCVEMDKLLEAERHRAQTQASTLNGILTILGSINSVSSGLDGRIRQLAGLADALLGSVGQVNQSVDSINGSLADSSRLIKESVGLNAMEVKRLATEAVSLSEQVRNAVNSLSGDVSRSAKDVTTVRNELVQAAEFVTRELGARGN